MGSENWNPSKGVVIGIIMLLPLWAVVLWGFVQCLNRISP